MQLNQPDTNNDSGKPITNLYQVVIVFYFGRCIL